MSKLTSEYQKKVEKSLKKVLQNVTDVEVKREHGSKIEKENGTYSPRMDIVIFPEAERPGTHIYDKCSFLKRSGETKDFIERIIENSMNSEGRSEWYDYNKNPRYFIGIEIENGTSKNFKHVLGSMTNLSALCYMGIIVFYKSDMAVIKRLEEYMSFVYQKKKIDVPIFPNVFILKRDDFEEIVPVKIRQNANWNFRWE